MNGTKQWKENRTYSQPEDEGVDNANNDEEKRAEEF